MVGLSLLAENKKYVFSVFVFLAVIVGMTWHVVTRNPLSSYVMPSMQARFVQYYVDEKFPSRSWLQYAKSIVQDHEYPPAEAARFYAYVTSVYSDVYDVTNDQKQAIRAPWHLITHIYPYTKPDPTFMLLAIQSSREVTLSPKATEIVDMYKKRWDEREIHSQSGVQIPGKKDGWISKTEKGFDIAPLNPDAGLWPRWVLTNDTFDMPAPPTIGSEQDLREIQEMKDSLAQREAWRERIFLWWGGKGTGTPSFQWQDIMHDAVADTMDDKMYARYQKNLAQALADTFIICWEKKYTYWTARPWMRIPGFKPIAETPPFPGYPSGHSTVSASAAVILGSWFPDHAADFMAMAEEARDTRLYAGIHFEVDNTEGFDLGKRIAAKILGRLENALQ